MQEDIAEVLVAEEQIRAKVAELGKRISEDHRDQGDALTSSPLLVIGLLRGAAVFLSDLIREIDIPIQLDFMGISSYGISTESGAVRLVMDLETDIAGRRVLIVEDIVDTGKTLSYLVDTLRARHPASLRICALLDKPDRRQVPIDVDYVGFVIPDKFVVGYGIDFAEGYRNLPFVGVLKEHLYARVLIRGAILQQINGYLRGEIRFTELIEWAQDTLATEELSTDDESLLRDLVDRACKPDSEAVGLTMEEWSDLLNRLGQKLQVSTRPLV
jgi:hypoxanthine phosphoribosyltransferase